jgi:phospho-N-acetylmuramoyl-pentapeptide-transferase
MGGFIIILATMIPCLLFADLTNIYIQLMIFTTIWMALIGFADDYIKVFRKNKDGLHGKFKIFGQVVLGLVVGLVMVFHDDVVVRVPVEVAEAESYEVISTFDAEIVKMGKEPYLQKMAYAKASITNIPFIKNNELNYKYLVWFLGDNGAKFSWLVFVLIVVFIVTSVSNAANLTDGIDGLAAGVSAIIGATLGILAYVSGNTIIADYLNILYIPFTGELVIFTACFVGGCVGFLWYNSYPAKVFMGDTGSLMIGV